MVDFYAIYTSIMESIQIKTKQKEEEEEQKKNIGNKTKHDDEQHTTCQYT